jgi:lysophospholipase L1-like esterase
MKKIAALLLSIFLFIPLMGQIRILTIGDSTMADYDEEKNSGEKEMRGWVQMLPIFLNRDIKIDNAAKNGRSSKSFYREFWGELRNTLKKGDYVIIQFGHNDEKNDGLDSDDLDPKSRGTAPWGQYQEYLTKYINESRERGATPVLATPIVRRLFDSTGTAITGKGLHNLGDNDSILNYSLAMRAVAKQMNVPLIDMTLFTQQIVERLGPEESKKNYLCKQ